MRKLVMMISLILAALCVYAAETDRADEIKKKLTDTFANMPVSEVEKSEINGLYEVHTGQNIIYSDGNYLMMGHIFDLEGKDITQEKINSQSAKLAASLDKSKAIKLGSGKKEVIEFTDPECPYCLKAEAFFKGADVTRYVYFFPLSFHKNAERLSLHILCSDNPEKEYKRVIDSVEKGEADSFKTISCDAGKKRLAQMKEAAGVMGVRGTPFFIVDGTVISGADPKIVQLLK